MIYSKNNPGWVRRKMLEWRWWFIAVLGLLIIVSEIREHPFKLGRLDPVLIMEVIFYEALLLFTAFLLDAFLSTLAAKAHNTDLLALKNRLGQQLFLAPDWNEQLERVLQFLPELRPLAGERLLLYNPNEGSYEISASWDAKAERASLHQTLDSFAIRHTCPAEQPPRLHRLLTKPAAKESRLPEGLNGYCLPLSLGGHPLARLYLYLPAGAAFTSAEEDILNNVRSDLAIALETALLRKTRSESLLAQAADAERSVISRDLHDTLGQNLCYLQFKLDWLIHDQGSLNFTTVKPELEQMRAVAGESYEIVRGTLAALLPADSSELINILQDHCDLVRERADVEINFTVAGQPHSFERSTVRQIFYIFNEALSNVARHAGAQKVEVALIFGEGDLTIKVSDDGAGFDLQAGSPAGHYGLRFMRERAAAIGGHLEVRSTPGAGTLVSLQIPYAPMPDLQPCP